MVRQPVTRLQLSGQRLLVRRMTHALVRRDVAMHDDPLRVQSISLAAGGVLAALVVAVAVVVGLVRDGDVPESALIVIAHDSGALYVRVGDVLHPVLNLASARLVARAPENPVQAADAAIAAAKRGPSMGIPGAPPTIGKPLGGLAWTVCDDDRTVVAVGPPEDGRVGRPDPARPVLVTPRGEGAGTTFLMYDGVRAAVDLRNVAVVRALAIDGVEPVPVSRTLLDVVPEVPAIEPPVIAGVGGPGPAVLPGVTVGSVVAVRRTDVVEHYVVLRDGLQSLGEVAADLIAFTYDGGAQRATSVAPAAVAALPIVTSLPTRTFPERVHPPVGAADRHAVCVRWSPGGATRTSSKVVVFSGDSPYPDPAALAQADGEGPNVDAVVIRGGTGAYVRSARIVGDDGATGARFLVTDAGVVFGVHDDDAASSLGLGAAPEPAPWPVLAHLPRGPELSVESASLARDGLPAAS